jgi:hypothetical protein
LRYANCDGPVHWNGYGAVDLNVLRDNVFRSVSWGVSVKSVELKTNYFYNTVVNVYYGIDYEVYRSVLSTSTSKFVVSFERFFFPISYYYYFYTFFLRFSSLFISIDVFTDLYSLRRSSSI